MNLDFYKREINQLAKDYNKIRFRYIFLFIALLFWLIWIGVLIVFLKAPDTDQTPVIQKIFIGVTIACGTVGIGVLFYYVAVINKRTVFLKTKMFKLIAKILTNESGYWIEPLGHPVKEIMIKTNIVNRHDRITEYFSFRFNINDIFGTYILQKVMRSNGNSSTEILNGDLIILPYSNQSMIQIRDRREYWLRHYKYQPTASDSDCFLYLYKEETLRGNYKEEKNYFRKLKRIYPGGTKCGIAYHPGKVAFFANLKTKYKIERRLDFEKFKNYTTVYYDVLRRIENIINIARPKY